LDDSRFRVGPNSKGTFSGPAQTGRVGPGTLAISYIIHLSWLTDRHRAFEFFPREREMLALPLRLSLRPHLFGTQKRLVTSSSQRSVLLSPRNVSRNGSDLNASETGTVKTNDFVSLSLPKDSPLSGNLFFLFSSAMQR
jgi:hypothetical protein